LCINTLVSYGDGRLEKGLGTKLYYDGSHEQSALMNTEEIDTNVKKKSKDQTSEEITRGAYNLTTGKIILKRK
jgi:hypothetical protein